MTAEEVLAELEKLGTAQNRKIYARHGVTDPCFGVSYANLEKLVKQLKKEPDPERNQALWNSGNHDARALALKLVRPEDLSARMVDRWAREVSSPVIAGDFGVMLGRSGWEGVEKTAERWLRANPKTRPQVAAAGWCLVSALAAEDNDWADERWTDLLARIEAEIQSAPNRIRHVMNNALIAIGSRNPALRKKAEAVAKRIGKVEVDHGETSCQTPDAIAYLEKVWAHKAKKKKARRRC